MYVNDVVRNGEVAWIAPKAHNPGTIRLVKEVMCKNTPMITRHTFEQKENYSIYSQNQSTKQRRKTMFQ